MTKKTLSEWSPEITLESTAFNRHAACWTCALCGHFFEVAVRDTPEAAEGLARLAFMDHMEKRHGDRVRGERKAKSVQARSCRRSTLAMSS